MRLGGEAGNPLAAERRNVWVITTAITAALLWAIVLLVKIYSSIMNQEPPNKRKTDFTVSKDSRIEPRKVATTT